jgi:hypothetical protein
MIVAAESPAAFPSIRSRRARPSRYSMVLRPSVGVAMGATVTGGRVSG